MTDEPRPKRNRLVVDLPDEDREWIRAQSAATGWHSEALVVRMLIKDAREKGLSFAVVAASPRHSAPRAYPTGTDLRPGRINYVDHPDDLAQPYPVEPAEVDSLLAGRLSEAGIDAAAVATEPWPEMASASQPLAVNGGVAISLEPAPKRLARDYR